MVTVEVLLRSKAQVNESSDRKADNKSGLHAGEA